MADVLGWVVDHANIWVDVALVLLAGDRWVHRRERIEWKLAEDLKGTARDLKDLQGNVTAHRADTREAFDRVNTEASLRHSAIMGRLGQVELDIRELQTIIGRRRHFRPDQG